MADDSSEKTYSLEICAPEDCHDRVQGLLALDVPFGWEESSLPTGETVFLVHSDDRSFLEGLARSARFGDVACRIGEKSRQDWLQAFRDFFRPLRIGRFLVLPPWENPVPPSGAVRVVIEPKSAFGTGQHATTALCLELLDALLLSGRAQAGQKFLDLGCGSGILGIAAEKCGLSGLGLDTDRLAVENAVSNSALNGCANLEIREGSIGDAGARRFDLVFANILARPLIELAPAIAAALEPGGRLVLSGILDIQEKSVADAYEAQGLSIEKSLERGEWRALLLRSGN